MDSQDALLTDRGAYLETDDAITIASTDISRPGLCLSSSFTIVVWARPLTGAVVQFFDKNDLQLSINSSDQLCFEPNRDHSACFGIAMGKF